MKTFKECENFPKIQFGNSYLSIATNVTRSICCDFCADFNICKSYTYFEFNRTCLLYDSLHLPHIKCNEEHNCHSGRICKRIFSLILTIITYILFLFISFPRHLSFSNASLNTSQNCYHKYNFSIFI